MTQMKKSMNFAFKKADDSPGFLLWRLTNQWQQQQRKVLRPLGVTHPQFVALAGILWLNNQVENGISQTEVAEFTHIDKMMMSDLIKTLVKKKFVERTRQKTDKRAYFLNLTSKGHEVVLKAIPLVEKVDLEFFNKKTMGLEKLVSIISRRFANQDV